MTTDMNAKMLDDLLNVEDGLGEWEVEFIESLSHRGLSEAGTLDLSPRQEKKLDELWHRHVGGSDDN